MDNRIFQAMSNYINNPTDANFLEVIRQIRNGDASSLSEMRRALTIAPTGSLIFQMLTDAIRSVSNSN